MVSALGVNQAWLFTAVFALGALLAGLGGALQLAREPANLEMDLNTIGAAFVVVVVGGMGSIPGAYAAALLIAEIKAVCIWLGVVQIAGISLSFSKLTLVVEFLVMATVLVARPWGLMGRAQAPSRYVGMQEEPLRGASRSYLVAAALLGLALISFLGWLLYHGIKDPLENFRRVLESVAENHPEYRDWNSTTTQSDRGECLHVLLDFLRIKAEQHLGQGLGGGEFPDADRPVKNQRVMHATALQRRLKDFECVGLSDDLVHGPDCMS